MILSDNVKKLLEPMWTWPHDISEGSVSIGLHTDIFLAHIVAASHGHGFNRGL